MDIIKNVRTECEKIYAKKNRIRLDYNRWIKMDWKILKKMSEENTLFSKNGKRDWLFLSLRMF